VPRRLEKRQKPQQADVAHFWFRCNKDDNNLIMQIETLQTNLKLTRFQGPTESKMSAFDFPALIATMKRSRSWANGELNAMILLRSPDKQIILTAMHKGTEIESFQSNDSVTFRIIEGKLKLYIRKDSITIKQDQLMILKEHLKYRLTSQEDTIFLLTITNDITRAGDN
jgi:hypothetical protein